MTFAQKARELCDMVTQLPDGVLGENLFWVRQRALEAIQLHEQEKAEHRLHRKHVRAAMEAHEKRVREKQDARRAWQALPWWKRWRTPYPR